MPDNLNTSELLARLDERSKAMQESLVGIRNDIALQNQRFDVRINEERIAIISKIEKLEKEISENYVTKENFDPVKRIVYSLVSVVLGSVLVAIIAMVVNN